MMRSPTRYKFRHYRPGEDGVSRMIWASDGPEHSLNVGSSIVKGSAEDLEVIEAQLWTPNGLTDQGELDMLDVYFDDQAVRTTLYFRLWGASLSADTVTDATAGEISGTGYSGITVTRGTDWGAPASGSTTSTTKTFTGGSGGWSAATWLALCTLQSGTGGLMICTAALSTSRTLLENDTLDVSMNVALD